MRIVFIQVLEKFYVRVSSSFGCCCMCISLVVMEDVVKLPHWVNGSQHVSASIFIVCEPLKMKVMCLQITRNHLHSDAIPRDFNPHLQCFEDLKACSEIISC